MTVGLRALYRLCGLLLVGVVLLAGCQNQGPIEEIRTRPRDLLKSPAEYIGKTVSISGEVDRIFGPRSFTVGGEEFGQSLLIVSEDSIAPVGGRTAEIPAAENDIVQVTGVVRRFDSTAFRKKYDVQLPSDAVSEFQGHPVVAALQGSQAMHGVVVSPRISGTDRSVVNDLAMATDPSNQSALHRRVAAFPRAPIQSVMGDRLIWIGTSNNERLPVVLNSESVADDVSPKPGQMWALHGIFRRLPGPGILRTDWDLTEEQIAQLKTHEVYLNAIQAEPVSGTTTSN